MKNKTYWADTCQPILGLSGYPAVEKTADMSILVIGAGFAGASAALHLANQGVKVTMIDKGMGNASYYRNAGHILHGMGESYKAMCAIKGRDVAKQLFEFSADCIHQISNSIPEPDDIDLSVDTHYIIAEGAEAEEQFESNLMLQEDGIKTPEELSMSAHPVKFRNLIINKCLSAGVRYHSNITTRNIRDDLEGTYVTFKNGTIRKYDAIVMATNAFAPLITPDLKKNIEPFRGQIVVSEPFKEEVPQMSFSSDHGYIYGQITSDNRLLIGGWRNNSKSNSHTYYLGTVTDITKGLTKFVAEKMKHLPHQPTWEYCWSGIMGASHNGMPVVGPMPSSPRIFSCAGFTGYGFSFAFGCGRLVSDIILGEEIPEVAYLFRP